MKDGELKNYHIEKYDDGAIAIVDDDTGKSALFRPDQSTGTSLVWASGDINIDDKEFYIFPELYKAERELKTGKSEFKQQQS